MTTAAVSGILGQVGGVLFWSLVIVALVVTGFVVVSWVKRWASDAEEVPAGGFTLGELRRLHQEGQMSDEEYEKAKGMIVEAAKAMAAKRAERDNEERKRELPPGLGR